MVVQARDGNQPGGTSRLDTSLTKSPVSDLSTSPRPIVSGNQEENIFGWIQPDEWETVAGPNKLHFMQGHCVSCQDDTDDQNKHANSTANAQDIACGGPNCGYGASCCAYSKRACRSAALAPNAPTTSTIVTPWDQEPQRSTPRSPLGVTLIDIIHGRSCRPISLLDFRTFLLLQRLPHRRHPAYMPASDMANSNLAGLSDISADGDEQNTAPTKSVSYDEVDALDFLIAVERYKKKFRELPKADRLQSPDLLTCKAAINAYVRKQGRSRISSENHARRSVSNRSALGHGFDDQDWSREVLARATPQQIGLAPESQPMRRELDHLIRRYLGWPAGSRSTTNGTNKTSGKAQKAIKRLKYGSGSSSSTIIDEDRPHADSDAAQEKETRHSAPRLRWMVDVGLISDRAVALALAQAEFSTHPDVLDVVADMISKHMSVHVLPYFFISASKNLSTSTSRGRFVVGFVCLVIAIVFTVLLLLTPSPLAPNANGGTGNIIRWWRLLLTPLWGAAVGYILAYRTGVCVWLTLRGNREPDEEEEREREQIRSRISDDAAGFSFAEVEADADIKDAEEEAKINKWMAPELADVLSTVIGRGKTRTRKSTDSVREMEEGTSASKDEAGQKYNEKELDELQEEEKHQLPEMPTLAHTADLGRTGVQRLNSAALILETSPSSFTGMSISRSASDVHEAPLEPLRMSAQPFVGSGAFSIAPSDASETPVSPSLIKPVRVPLLPLMVGVVKAPMKAEDVVENTSPAFTKDALNFDPELMARGQATHKTKKKKKIWNLWRMLQQSTGFAVGTERVLDSRVRRAQQIEALKAMALCFGATFVIMVIIVAVP